MIDIDNFKKVNDTYGHQEGDFVLKKVGRIIKENVRKYDIASRYGGEEISIIMPNVSEETAYRIIDRIRKKIKNEFTKKNITVSAGISILRKIDKPSYLVKRADEYLYSAKKTGRIR